MMPARRAVRWELALFLFLFFFLLVVSACDARAPDKPKHAALDGFHAYDDTGRGVQQIAEATARAKAEHKRVLVIFGGNWCKWCKALDALLETEPRIQQLLANSYIVVHVDSDSNLALNEAYGNPFSQGFPVLVLLDQEGIKLHVQETGSLEKDDKSVGHDAERVILFLKRWASS